MTVPQVCVVGAANIDLVSSVPRLPAWGETLHGTGFRLGYGGKGANQAVMAAKLGAEVSIVTKVGQDGFGSGTLDNLRRWGVDTTYVTRTDEAVTGVAPIFVNPAGENAIVIVTGANDLVTAGDIERAEPAMARAGAVLCQLEVPVETTLRALRQARAAGTRTILNPAPARDDLPQELFALSDVFCPNRGEAALIARRRGHSIDDLAGAAALFRNRGAGSVVITLGEEGCLVVDDEGVDHLPGEQVTAVDTTGAGDAFMGALAFCLARGDDLRESARLAGRVAALSVLGHGTQSSFPDRDDLPEDLRSALRL